MLPQVEGALRLRFEAKINLELKSFYLEQKSNFQPHTGLFPFNLQPLTLNLQP